MGRFKIHPTTQHRTIRFGVFEADLRTRELRKLKIKIQEKPFQILALLLERPGEVVTREELRQRLWADRGTFVDFDHSLGTAVGKLRHALNDSAQKPQFVETLGGVGFRFVAPVEAGEQIAHRATEIAVPPTDGLGERNDASQSTARRSRTSFYVGIGGVVIALAAGFFGLDRATWLDRLRGAHANPGIRSLAVLPLDNLSHDPGQDYFADGMTDELITILGKISALRVISRTSVMSYKGTRKPLAQIARELKVDAVVEGTVLQSAGRVRITAQLIRVRPENHIWAERYERDIQEILALQAEVAADIARGVRSNLGPVAGTGSTKGIDPEAHAAYLKGLYHVNRYTEEEIQRGIEFFNQAVRLDPFYAPPHAGLARAYTLLSTYYRAPRDVMPKARAAAMKALDLDETLPEAHVALGNVELFYDWDWKAAEREFRRAIELNPNSADAYDGYANYLVAMGREEQSVAESKRAIELDPLSLVINSDAAGNTFYFAHRYDEDIELCRRTIEFDPSFGLVHFYLAQAYARLGHLTEALAQSRIGYNLDSSPVMIGLLGEVYAFLGKRVEAGQVLRRLDELSKSRYVCSYETASIYQGLGRKTEALRWLEKAYEERSDCIPWLKVDPAFDGLRGEARFQALLRRSDLQ